MKFLFGKGKENTANPMENHENNQYWDKTKEGKNPFIKGIINLNQWLNPNHDWFDYSDMQGTIDSVKDKYTGTGLTQAEQEANEFSSSEAQKSRDWEEYMARNKYAMETQSMESAGLNPAMVYGGGSLVPTVSNGASASSVTPQSGDLFDVISTIARLRSEINLADAQAEEAKASAKEKSANAENTEKRTSWIDKMNELDAQAKEISMNLDKDRSREIEQNIKTSAEQAKKLAEEATTEQEKRLLYLSERRLNEANVKQVAEMLPYHKAMAEAQTTLDKANASLAFVNAAYQNGLIDAGYIDALVGELTASKYLKETQEGSADVERQLKAFEYRVKSKQFSPYVEMDGENSLSDKVVEGLYSGLSTLRGAIVGYK